MLNAATLLPFEVFSVGNSGVVMPIWLTYSSPASDSRLACCRLPAEAPGAAACGVFGDRNGDGLAMDEAARLGRLCVRDAAQRVVRDRLDEAQAEDARRSAKRAHLVAVEDSLLDRSVDGARVDQGPARVIDEGRAVQVSGAQLEDLAVAADHGVLVAVGTRDGVVDGTDAVGDRRLPGEDLLDLDELGLGGVAVRSTVESRRRLGRHERDGRLCVGQRRHVRRAETAEKEHAEHITEPQWLHDAGLLVKDHFGRTPCWRPRRGKAHRLTTPPPPPAGDCSRTSSQQPKRMNAFFGRPGPPRYW